MTEMKVYHCNEWHNEYTEFYMKSEADKVISTIRAERDEYRYNLSCARNEIHNMQIPMREYIKRIADKDKEIAELKEQYKDMDVTHTVHIAKMNAKIDKLEEDVAWNKYKRCLAMAKWCDAMKSYFNESGFFDVYANERMVFYERWHNRWLELAEQFKEAK